MATSNILVDIGISTSLYYHQKKKNKKKTRQPNIIYLLVTEYITTYSPIKEIEDFSPSSGSGCQFAGNREKKQAELPGVCNHQHPDCGKFYRSKNSGLSTDEVVRKRKD